MKKKEPDLQQVNHAVLQHLQPDEVEVEICRADELEMRRGLSSELDEMWSFVRAKTNPRWLWHAIDHGSGKVLAYVFGRRKDSVFLQLQTLLEPFGITRYYTDGWGAYERHLDADKHRVGKDNTQKIESKHINLRTRKMFQTCGSATLSESERTINAREGSDDHPSAALPLLPRDGHCQAWFVTWKVFHRWGSRCRCVGQPQLDG